MIKHSSLVLSMVLLAGPSAPSLAQESSSVLEVQPAAGFAASGGQKPDADRDGNSYDGFIFDFVNTLEVRDSQTLASFGTVLDFEADTGFPDADVMIPPPGNLLSSPDRNPFGGQTSITSLMIGGQAINITAASLNIDAETKVLADMVRVYPPGEAGVYVVADEGGGDSAPSATFSGKQALMASPASLADRDVGMLLTFEPPVSGFGIAAFNRSSTAGPDNNLDVAAFDADGNLLGRYRLPGGRSIAAGGKGTPMFVGLQHDRKPLAKVYVGHFLPSARNLTFDDLIYIESRP